jgi:ABC-2 type transport system ATP-binding protein
MMMIKITALEKSYDDFHVLRNLSLHVDKSSIYGLVGVNGAGKTTVIKHLTGILKQDSGTVTIDGENVYDNESIKKRVGYIPDELYFLKHYTIKTYEKFYKALYKQWNHERFKELTTLFGLDINRKLSKFSKGMQKQAAFAFIMSAMPDVMILDEPIDGLDPMVRNVVLKKIVEDVSEREMTVLLSSHNLKEMEGICDSIGIMRQGEVVIERNLNELKSDIHKIQTAFPEQVAKGVEKYESAGLAILHYETRGSLETCVIRGNQELVESTIKAWSPLVFDLLPLTLQEIFVYEMEGEYNEISN